MYNNAKYYKISGGCTLWIQNYPIHRLYHRFLVVLGKSVNALERKIKSLTGEYLVKGVLAEKVQVEKYAPNEYINPDFVKNCNILYPVLIAGFRLPSAICICSIRIPTGIKTDGKEPATTQRKWFSLRYRQRCGRISRHEPEQS